jgi:glycosyltransferase involved in cell wall biosynthesis
MNMLSTPSVTVIIPAYNAAQFLFQAVDSLMAQNYPMLEIIIIDENSTDNTAPAIQSFGPNVRYLQQACGGPAAARNVGLRLSQADFVGFLDADDLWMPGRLHSQIAFHLQHPELDYSQGYTRKIYLESHLASQPHYARDDAAHLDPNPGSLLFHRQALLQLGGFDESFLYGEDIDLCLRACATGMTGAVFEQVVLLYRMHANNMTNFEYNAHHDLLTVLYKSVCRKGRHPQLHPERARLPHLSDADRCFPLVSVIVIDRRSTTLLSETLQSIVRQSYPNLELLVMADRPISDLPTKSRLIHLESIDFASAVNQGWQSAQGEYLVCIQAGDVWPQDRLSQQVGVLHFNPGAGIVLGETRIVVDPLLYDLSPNSSYTALPGDHFGAALIRRHTQNLVGELDPAFQNGAGTEWLTRAAGASAHESTPSIIHIPRIVLYRCAENLRYFNIRDWSRAELTRILHKSIHRRRQGVK